MAYTSPSKFVYAPNLSMKVNGMVIVMERIFNQMTRELESDTYLATS